MELGGKKILVCNCEATMPLDGKALAKACAAASTAPVHHHLCRTEIARFHDKKRRAYDLMQGAERRIRDAMSP